MKKDFTYRVYRIRKKCKYVYDGDFEISIVNDLLDMGINLAYFTNGSLEFKAIKTSDWESDKDAKSIIVFCDTNGDNNGHYIATMGEYDIIEDYLLSRSSNIDYIGIALTDLFTFPNNLNVITELSFYKGQTQLYVVNDYDIHSVYNHIPEDDEQEQLQLEDIVLIAYD